MYARLCPIACRKGGLSCRPVTASDDVLGRQGRLVWKTSKRCLALVFLFIVIPFNSQNFSPALHRFHQIAPQVGMDGRKDSTKRNGGVNLAGLGTRPSLSLRTPPPPSFFLPYTWEQGSPISIPPPSIHPSISIMESILIADPLPDWNGYRMDGSKPPTSKYIHPPSLEIPLSAAY